VREIIIGMAHAQGSSMQTRIWSILPVLAALLACKQPSGSAENSRASAPLAAEPGTEPASAKPGGKPRSDGRTPLAVIEGKARADNGFVIIPGEVKNDTGKWLRGVRIDIQLLDASGKSIHVDSIAAAEGFPEGVVASRTIVPPGEVAVFRYTRDIKKLAGTYASHRLQASGRITDASMSASVEGVDSSKDKLGFYTVTGRIKSTGTAGCRSPQAVIGLYASDGKLYDVKVADADPWFQKVMPAGQTAEFARRAIDGRDGVFSDIKVWGDCQL
jgi:hypothetical protein